MCYLYKVPFFIPIILACWKPASSDVSYSVSFSWYVRAEGNIRYYVMICMYLAASMRQDTAENRMRIDVVSVIYIKYNRLEFPVGRAY